MKIYLVLLFSFLFLSLSGQNYAEIEIPTIEGNDIVFVLTNKGVETLLEPIKVDNLGNLAAEILTIKKVSYDNTNKIEQLQKIVDAQAKVIAQLVSKIDISMDSNIDDIKEAYTVKELKAIAKQNKLSGYSRLNETELVELLIRNKIEL